MTFFYAVLINFISNANNLSSSAFQIIHATRALEMLQNFFMVMNLKNVVNLVALILRETKDVNTQKKFPFSIHNFLVNLNQLKGNFSVQYEQKHKIKSIVKTMAKARNFAVLFNNAHHCDLLLGMGTVGGLLSTQ